MKKIVLGAVLVLILTIGFGVYYILSNLDSLVKTAIETYGSQAVGTAVRVDSVKIGLKDGSGAIHGLTVANPNGYAAPMAFTLGEVATRIDLKSLSEPVIVIDHVTVRAPKIYYEMNSAGKNNLDQLKQNLAAQASSAGAGGNASSAPAQASGAEPKIQIRKLLFEGGSIHAKLVPLDKEYDLDLPKIELTDLGGKNGATPEQISGRVMQVLTDRALDAVKKKGLDQYTEKVEGEVKQRLDAEQQKLGDKVGDKLKGVLNY